MKTNLLHTVRRRPAIFPTILACVALLPVLSVRAEWDKAEDHLAWKAGGETLWQYNWSTNQSKPFFHPLRVAGGESMTTLSPADHKHHYGLWFSWKYINEVNYWELEKNSNRSKGPTLWDAPEITTKDDGSAVLVMNLRYVSPTNEALVLLAERRELKVSAPGKDGGVTIDWNATFTAGGTELLLDRTHMPGEPGGQVNGGYAGFSMRVAQHPVDVQFLTTQGPIEKFESERARPNSVAAACNMTQGGRTDGTVILSHPANVGGDSPWYIISSKTMRWFSPALIAPAAKKVAPNEAFTWKFRVVTKAGAWTPGQVQEAAQAYGK